MKISPDPPGLLWRALLVPLGGLLLAFGFAQPRWIAGLLGLSVLLVLAVRAPSPLRAFQDGWIAGFTFFGWLLAWLAMSILLYSDLGGVLALMAVVAAAAGLGLGWGVVFWGAARWARRWGPGPGIAAGVFLFVGYELLRLKYPVPFPWGVLGASAPGLRLGFLHAGLGSTGVSLFLALMAGTLALAGARVRSRLWPASMLLALAFLGGAGWWRAPVPPSGPPVKIAVLQGSVEREDRGTEGLFVYRDLTAAAARAGARVIVWPEGATSFQIDEDPPFRAFLEDLATRLDVELILNSLTGDGHGGWENSAILITPGDGWVAQAAKRQLAPFGEYIPWRWLLGNIPALAHEIGDLTPGRSTTLFSTRAGKAGPLVCFEGVFPGLACEQAGMGAGLLVNLTNDSWFGVSDGPAQHLDHARCRTWETQRPLIRAANSGISAVIDAGGRPAAELGVGERGFLLAEVAPGAGPAPGCRAGAVLRPICASLSFLALAGALIGPRRRPENTFPIAETDHAG